MCRIHRLSFVEERPYLIRENMVVIWPLLLYAAVVVILAAGTLSLSFVLGERHKEPSTGEPYESGIASTGSTHIRFSAQFYVAAMFFVILDLEAVFIFSWAIALKEAGWTGYIGALIFIGIFAAVLIYTWRIGAFDFGPKGKNILSAYKKLKR